MAASWVAAFCHRFTTPNFCFCTKGRHARACALILSVGSGAHSHDHTGDRTGGCDLDAGLHRMSCPRRAPASGATFLCVGCERRSKTDHQLSECPGTPPQPGHLFSRDLDQLTNAAAYARLGVQRQLRYIKHKVARANQFRMATRLFR
jgi:hypothetical protein